MADQPTGDPYEEADRRAELRSDVEAMLDAGWELAGYEILGSDGVAGMAARLRSGRG